MINNQFLLYRTLAAYQADVNNIKPTSIVFVVEDGTVRTHGFVFGGKFVDPDDLADYIRKDEIAQYIPEQPVVGDKKHVFLTQEEYDALEEYEKDTIYFILEPAEPQYENNQFGGAFPLQFGNADTNP